MRIVVCIKQIMDPEIPPRIFQVDRKKKQAIRGNAELVINPFDENAIEVALKIKDQQKGSVVTVVTLGGETGDNALKRALSMGCDEAIWLKDPVFENMDSFGIAKVLGKGIIKAGNTDIILAGFQAGDWDMSQVGPFLAEELTLPCITLVWQIEVQEQKLIVKREVEKGIEILELSPPFLATVTSSSANQPRYPSLRGILAATRKEVPVWSAQDLQIAEKIPRLSVIEDLIVPSYDRVTMIIEGENGTAKGIKLARCIAEMNIV